MISSMIPAMDGWTGGMADLFMSAGVRGAVFLALILAITAAMRSASAATRHTMLAAGVIGVLAMPFATLLPLQLPVLPELPTFSVQSPTPERATPAPGPIRSQQQAELEEILDAEAITAFQAAPEPAAAPAPVVPSAPARIPLELMLAAFWAMGMLIVGTRALFGEWKARRMVSRAVPVEDETWMPVLWESADLMEIDFDVRLLRSEESAVAFTMGAVQPVIVIPASSDEWTEDRRRAVLLHELAHIRRRDVVLHNLGRLVTVMYWFNPLVWIAAARLRSESERAADDLVIQGGTRPSDYADHLLQIVTGTSAFQAPAPVLPFARKREFEGRIMAVLEAERPRSHLSAARRAAIFGGIALLALPIASLSAASGSHGTDSAIKSAGAGTGIDVHVDEHVDVDHTIDEDADVDVDVHVDEPGVDAAAMRNDAISEEAVEAMMQALPARLATPDLRRAFESAQMAAAGALNPPAFDPRAIAALIEALLNDGSADVRRHAAFALGELEAEQAVDALLQALARDTDADVRRGAALALAEIESPESVDGLLAAAGDANADVRHAAMIALGELRDPASLDGLIVALSDPNPQVRARAAFAIGEVEPDSAPAELVRLLDDPDGEVRFHALIALREIEDPATANAISRLLDDPDSDIRGVAIDALTEMDEVGIEVLLRALNDGDADIRARAARALGEL